MNDETEYREPGHWRYHVTMVIVVNCKQVNTGKISRYSRALEYLFEYSMSNLVKGHLSWSFYFLYVLGIVNLHMINYILVSISSEF